MIRPIIKYNDAVLRQPAQPVMVFDTELEALITDLLDTCRIANGLGLAAPQVGVALRAAVVDPSGGQDPESHVVLINPTILDADDDVEGDDEYTVADEGCLSLPGFQGPVCRREQIVVTAQDVRGLEQRHVFTGLEARIVAHEFDHLNGQLFIRHLSSLRREIITRKVEHLRRRGQW